MLNTPYRYVLPIPDFLRGKLLAYNRLYAYPNVPEAPAENGFVILDSGAFFLYKSKGKMDEAYMERMDTHYHFYSRQDRYFCVAPDVSKNPKKTMQNWLWWQSQSFKKDVCPVFQFENKGFPMHEIEKQVDFYMSNGANMDFVFFAKRGLMGVECLQNGLDSKLEYIKENCGTQWIHTFAGGWSLDDTKGFSKIHNLDSIDSIAYYESKSFLNDWRAEGANKTEKAIQAAKNANQVFYRI